MAYGDRYPGEFNATRGATDATNSAYGPLGNRGPYQEQNSADKMFSKAAGKTRPRGQRILSDADPNNMPELSDYEGQDLYSPGVAAETNQNIALNRGDRGPVNMSRQPSESFAYNPSTQPDTVDLPEVNPTRQPAESPAYGRSIDPNISRNAQEGAHLPKNTFDTGALAGGSLPQGPPDPGPVNFRAGRIQGANPNEQAMEQGAGQVASREPGSDRINGPVTILPSYEENVNTALQQMEQPNAPVGPNSSASRYGTARGMLAPTPDPHEVAASEFHHMGVGGRFKQAGLGALEGLARGGVLGMVSGGILGATGDTYKRTRSYELENHYEHQRQAGLDYLNVLKSEDAAEAAYDRAASAEERVGLQADRNRLYGENNRLQAEARDTRAKTGQEKADTDKDYKKGLTRQGDEKIAGKGVDRAEKKRHDIAGELESGKKTEAYKERTGVIAGTTGSKAQAQADAHQGRVDSHEAHVDKKGDQEVKRRMQAGREKRISDKAAQILEDKKAGAVSAGQANNPYWVKKQKRVSNAEALEWYEHGGGMATHEAEVRKELESGKASTIQEKSAEVNRNPAVTLSPNIGPMDLKIGGRR